jgi:hypothetical protein
MATTMEKKRHGRVDLDLPDADIEKYTENIIRRNKKIFDRLSKL